MPKKQPRERATEIEYLAWFKVNADFGPADSDVHDAMSERFIRESGKNLPDGWNYYQDGETLTDNYQQ